MPLVLHLSDLHLTQDRANKSVDDHKTGSFVDEADRRTLGKVILDTFDKIASDLKRDNVQLSAIVVSGDITNQGDVKGMSLFAPLLERLLPHIVDGDRARIVVVPGNHDVRRGQHGNRDIYYEGFLAAAEGCTRPFLQGVSSETEDPVSKYLLLPEDRLLVLPIDSCRYCSAPRELPRSFQEALQKLKSNFLVRRFARGDLAALDRQIDDFLIEDAARLSSAQFDFLEKAVSHAETACKSEGVDHNTLTRIAVLHHQLLPVTLSEEDKPFESLTNLMQLRYFLRRRGFKVVLHGHKHVQAHFWDLIPDLSDPAAPGWRMLVLAAPMLGEANTGHYAVQLLDFDTVPEAPMVQVKSAPLYQGDRSSFWNEAARPFFLYKQPGLPGATDGRLSFITGANIREVHARALQFLELAPDFSVQGFVCHLDADGISDQLAQLYQERCIALDSRSSQYPSDPRRRFAEIVGWWQNKAYPLVGNESFNHGSRLVIGSKDQLDTAVNNLKRKWQSTKAIISFIRPEIDLVEEGAEFPSFCTLQLLLRKEGRRTYVDAISYFRKQEIGVWWLFNVAEILTIQESFARILGDCEVGRITTVAARAELSEVMPQVAVPALERAATMDAGREAIKQMCVALRPDISAQAKGEALDRWTGMLAELRPPKKFSSEGVLPVVQGLDLLAEQMRAITVQDRPSQFDSLLENVIRLREENVRHRNVLRKGTPTAKDESFQIHQRIVPGLIEAINGLVRQVLT
jgi:3',5'-cyclic AMP phosphodiesterase CpdA